MTAPTHTTVSFSWDVIRQRIGGLIDFLLLNGVRLLFFLFVAILLHDGTADDHTLRGRSLALSRDYLFDYATWEINALWSKTQQELFGIHPYLDENTRAGITQRYLQDAGTAQQLEWQITRLYSDPDVADPDAASAGLRAERDALRRRLAEDQPLVESIIEGQVAAVLIDEGFDLMGQVIPPVSMHFTEVPTLLVVSPRDRIEFAVDINLTGLSVDEREALEDRIDSELDVASLVVPLGGLSLYPSMILETSGAARAFEVTAHEWTHHYLMFFPLGWEYGTRPDTRIINETVATLLGREIALKVLARYYPDVEPPVYPSFSADSESSSADDASSEAPPVFDYYTELHETRVTVDDLLEQGRVEEAEAYMETRRREFVRNGYTIRKLNQAYFAFYGSYQGAPGAGGTDPIGPGVQELRERSPDLKTWLRTMRGITTRDQLLATLDDARARP
ncbi:MAG: hypothetical protein JW966_01190 [Anaerolineae bacterium]|nr:hypothetical protein [Anaerolineae bacterium]